MGAEGGRASASGDLDAISREEESFILGRVNLMASHY